MSAFSDLDAAARAAKRIEDSTHRKIGDYVLAAAEATSRPDQAVANLERWIAATGSPTTMADVLTTTPELGRILVLLFGASHQIADVLVQNPELANLVLDPALLDQRPSQASLDEQIQSLLAESTSYSHSLDRLRFVKQSWHLRIAAADLAGLWPEPDVWKALTVVADSLVNSAKTVVWNQRGQPEPCPVSIVGMGKLGAQELNFSSDIDLVYVLRDDADEQTERLAGRFCEALSRALADRMGRGALYRVDLRLRPYGSRGPIAPRMKAVEGYYERYAEGWEHLALLRSRIVAGDDETERRWRRMRESTCFQPQRGEWFVEDLLKMRARLEERHTEGDIKRGTGGIRDVEFLVHILQLLHGRAHPRLQDLNTLDAIQALAEERLLQDQAAQDLASAYTFLRQVEHRLQLLGDRQTHTLPADPAARAELAARTGYASLEAFESALALHRANARNWYQTLHRKQPDHEPRREVLQRSGSLAPTISLWFDALPSSESFYESILENESSLERIKAVADTAPALVPQLRASVSVTEQLMSGEILEPTRLTKPDDAQSLRRAWLRSVAKWALTQDLDLGAALADIYDQALAQILKGTGLRTIALGSYGARELVLYSDLDVVFWKDGPLDHESDEKKAQKALATIQALKRDGAPIELDLRLRPEGKKGRLVHNAETIGQYAQTTMQPWERLALARARAQGLPPAIRQAAFGTPLDGVTLDQLAKIKRRVETERVPIQHRNRHIKLGPGGQDDVLWTVHLLSWHEQSHETEPSIASRLPTLVSLNAVEKDQIQQAWRFYTRLRIHLGLLGLNDEVLPENPDKLARLGSVMGVGSGNELLAMFEAHREKVRAVFEGTMERLKG